MKQRSPSHFGTMMTGAKAIVECMKIEEISYVFCVPGESYLPILDALYDEPSINVISARHEGGAAFMAEGYAKSALKPGIVLATRGVGAANLSIGVHTAYQDSTPMVVFLGQVHSKFRGREGFQEVDLDQYFRHLAKWAVEIKDPERIPEIVQRAFRIAKTGRPGPVVVSLPEDILLTKALMKFGSKVIPPKPAPAEVEVNRIEALLATATHPLIIAGGGVKSSQAEVRLIDFAEKHQIPVAIAFRRHDVFPHDHPLFVGHLGLGTHPNVIQTVDQADLIMALGTRLSEITTQDYQIISPEKKLIHIDIDYETIGKVFPPDIGIVADITEALKGLSTIKIAKTWSKWAVERNLAYRKISSLKASKSTHLIKQIITTLANKLPNDALITNDAGNFAGWLHAFYPFIKRHTYVGPTSGAMGYGMPAAIGAKLAFSEKIVVSFSGDGGFMMTVQELETVVRHEIPIISLVFNNKMYGTIRMHQEIHYPKKVIATDLGEVSFANIAKSVGAQGYVVQTIEEFERALDAAMKNNKPTVIEILTDQEQISVSATITEIREQHKEKLE